MQIIAQSDMFIIYNVDDLMLNGHTWQNTQFNLFII